MAWYGLLGAFQKCSSYLFSSELDDRDLSYTSLLWGKGPHCLTDDEPAGWLADWETFQPGEVAGTDLFILPGQLVGHILEEEEVISFRSL